MQLLRDPIGTFTFVWALVACSSFDPNRLVPAPESSAEAGAAGWSYEAGATESSAGRAASGARGASPPLESAGSLGAGGAGGRSSSDEEVAGSRDTGDAAGEGGTQSESSRGGRAGASGGVAAHGGVDGGAAMGGASGRAGSGGGRSGASGHGGGGKSGASAQGGRGAAAGTGSGASAGQAAGGAATTAGAGGVAGAGASNGGGPNGTGASGGSSDTSDRSGLFFSEYVEGSGSYKALELRGAPATPLAGCQIATYSNGASSPNTLALDGAIGSSGVYVLCSSTLASAGAACDRSTNLSFNGNDAVALVCDGAALDVIGQIGFDPGTAWTGVDTSTANQTLRRRCGVNGGDSDGTDAFDPALEWVAFPADTFDGLGDPACG